MLHQQVKVLDVVIVPSAQTEIFELTPDLEHTFIPFSSRGTV